MYRRYGEPDEVDSPASNGKLDDIRDYGKHKIDFVVDNSDELKALMGVLKKQLKL